LGVPQQRRSPSSSFATNCTSSLADVKRGTIGDHVEPSVEDDLVVRPFYLGLHARSPDNPVRPGLAVSRPRLRIATRFTIKPMDFAESAAYLRQHPKLAGRDEPCSLTTPTARLHPPPLACLELWTMRPLER
jgi:hypothetical protein